MGNKYLESWRARRGVRGMDRAAYHARRAAAVQSPPVSTSAPDVETPVAALIAAATTAPDPVAVTAAPIAVVPAAREEARSADEPAAATAPAPAPSPLVPIDGRIVLEFIGSSNVRRAELNVATGDLEVTFAKGPRWRYGNVTPEMLEEWRAATSAGRWFHGAIKSRPQAHPATPVEESAPTGAV